MSVRPRDGAARLLAIATSGLAATRPRVVTTVSASGAWARAPGHNTQRKKAPSPVSSAPPPTTVCSSRIPGAMRAAPATKLVAARASSQARLARR